MRPWQDPSLLGDKSVPGRHIQVRGVENLITCINNGEVAKFFMQNTSDCLLGLAGSLEMATGKVNLKINKSNGHFLDQDLLVSNAIAHLYSKRVPLNVNVSDVNVYFEYFKIPKQYQQRDHVTITLQEPDYSSSYIMLSVDKPMIDLLISIRDNKNSGRIYTNVPNVKAQYAQEFAALAKKPHQDTHSLRAQATFRNGLFGYRAKPRPQKKTKDEN